MRSSLLGTFLASTLLLGCSSEAPTPLDGNSLADTPFECAFGTELSEWDDASSGLDLFFYEEWSTIDSSTELWDGAIEQIVAALGFDPGGADTYLAALAETDDGEFRYREISNERTGEGYLAWSFVQGDDTHGAIFRDGTAGVVATINQSSIEQCQVAANVVVDSCDDPKYDAPQSAELLATTGANLVVDGNFRVGRGSFDGGGDADWYRVDFEPDGECYGCFRPHAFVESDNEISEVCVFAEATEVAARGAGECAAGDPVEVGGLTGCCSTDLGQGVWLELPWDHLDGKGSSMYLRVTGADDASECSIYEFTYGHFGG